MPVQVRSNPTAMPSRWWAAREGASCTACAVTARAAQPQPTHSPWGQLPPRTVQEPLVGGLAQAVGEPAGRQEWQAKFQLAGGHVQRPQVPAGTGAPGAALCSVCSPLLESNAPAHAGERKVACCTGLLIKRLCAILRQQAGPLEGGQRVADGLPQAARARQAHAGGGVDAGGHGGQAPGLVAVPVGQWRQRPGRLDVGIAVAAGQLCPRGQAAAQRHHGALQGKEASRGAVDESTAIGRRVR